LTAVIVGASAAGVVTAEALRQEGYLGPIILVGDEAELPYDRPPLSKQLLAGTWDAERLQLRSLEHYMQLRIDLRLGSAATSLDTQRRIITLASGDSIAYDELVIATGLRPRLLAENALPGVHVLRDLKHALALRAELAVGRHAVVVGCGVLGAEIAASMRGVGLLVTVIDVETIPMLRALGPTIGSAVGALHRRQGIDLRLGTGVKLIGGEGRVEFVELLDGTTLPADIVVGAVGATPATAWLESSGLPLQDGVVCRSGCEVAPGIFAAGDIARWWSRLLGRLLRVEHRMNATEQGMAAARQIVHGVADFDPVPYFWSDQFGTRIQVYGIVPAEAEIQIVEGALGADRFLAHAVEEERIVGVIGWNMPQQVRLGRDLVGGPA
jgi:3-phenylpropionate/trans-cinnamate dioxygenase ferredoxin reductase subunit